jgi:hypothetical protein
LLIIPHNELSCTIDRLKGQINRKLNAATV